MAQASRKKFDTVPLANQMTRGVRESVLFICGAIAVYLFVSLVSYDPNDPGWSHTGGNTHANNVGGVAGAWFSDIFLYLFGYLAYLFPLMVGYAGWLIFRAAGEGAEEGFSPLRWGLRGAGFVLTMAAGTGLATMQFADPGTILPLGSGGILGDVTGNGLVTFFNFVGTTLLLGALFLTGVTLFTGLSWLRVMDITGKVTFNALALLYGSWIAMREHFARKPAEAAPAKPAKIKEAKRVTPRFEPVIEDIESADEPSVRPPLKVRPPKARQMPLFEEPLAGLPPLSLLDEAEVSSTTVSRDALETMSRRVESTLADFGIEVQVVSVEPGPVITRYEMQPAPGIKVSQITSLAKDLARALSVISVRVVEVIPGKPFIGLEIPNEHREIVRLREILKQKDPMSTSPLNLALGKDISGHPMSVDLARMPHLLVAGTTGSGKSVAINAMILSILYNASPKDVRLIMIDPKMLELSVYEGIPHLLAPVVTDMKEAANALRWCVAEMDKRYRLMSSLGVRNIAGYNRKVEDAIKNGKPLLDPFTKLIDGAEDQELPTLTPLPYIVVVVDELADMMMVVGKKVEELIARLAQKARASGIHLLLATQRPSVDVLTGLIKANIPTRISFQVSSKIDSRTILDQMGAEQLLGHGDMLYLAPGTGVPIRVHGAFVADHEVHRVVENLRGFGEPQYIEEVLQGESAAGGNYMGEEVDGESDELYDQAVRIVTETRRPSISSVQRRLKIGYNRAARMIEQMERAGVVGPLQSNGNREVLAPPPPQD